MFLGVLPEMLTECNSYPASQARAKHDRQEAPVTSEGVGWGLDLLDLVDAALQIFEILINSSRVDITTGTARG